MSWNSNLFHHEVFGSLSIKSLLKVENLKDQLDSLNKSKANNKSTEHFSRLI